jgi:predicted nucleic acid-binding protein
VIVADASVLVVALVDDTVLGDQARHRLRGEELAAPELVYLETTSALRRLVNRGHVPPRRAALAIDDLLDLPVQSARHPHLLPRAWELRPNLTVYDAAYVALAEELDVPLFTADQRLIRATGPRCTFELLTGLT